MVTNLLRTIGRIGRQRRQHQRQGVETARYAQARQRDIADPDLHGRRRGKPRGIGGIEIDDETHRRAWRVAATANAQAANFDQTGQRRNSVHDQPSILLGQIDPVVADQEPRVNLSRTPRQDQAEGEAGFARPRRPPDQHRLLADQHRRGVDARTADLKFLPHLRRVYLQELQIESGTSIQKLPVPFGFRSS